MNLNKMSRSEMINLRDEIETRLKQPKVSFIFAHSYAPEDPYAQKIGGYQGLLLEDGVLNNIYRDKGGALVVDPIPISLLTDYRPYRIEIKEEF